jgi:triosephosphate isomerase
MRTSYVIGNLKMNLLSREEARQYLSVLKREMQGKSLERTVCVLCPSFVHLSEFDHLPHGIRKGAQDVFWEKQGAYTGEVSPATLKDEGVEYVIVGHSERRLYGGETNEIVREKALATLKHHMTPIVCIGETEEERRADETDRVLSLQVQSIFSGLSKLQAEGIMIAYEPRWAIGSDRLPTTEEILSVRVLLRKILTEMFGAETADRIAVIYGGSVKSSFLGDVSWEAGMDGVLVGRESLFPYELVKMATMLEEEANKE